MKHKKHGHVKHHARAGMIYEDKNAPSNLPREVIMEEYPKVNYIYQPIDDTMYGVDHQMESIATGVQRQLAKKKY